MGRASGFVGRRTELARLIEARQAFAAHGGGGVVRVQGPAGSGKTMLIDEFRRRSPGESWRGVAIDLGDQPIPLLAVRDLVRDLRRSVGESPEPATERLLDELTVHGREVDVDLLVQALVTLDAVDGSLLVIEDLQHADAATERFVRVLASRLHERAITLVVSHRSESADLAAVATTVADLARLAETHTTTLDAFPRNEVAELYRALTGRLPDDATLHALIERGGGHPAFTAALVTSETEGFPDHVADSILQQVALLPRLVRSVLRVVAAARVIDVDDLVALVDADVESVHDAIRAGVEAHVLDASTTP